jgi:anti-sigma B factor antagonist
MPATAIPARATVRSIARRVGVCCWWRRLRAGGDAIGWRSARPCGSNLPLPAEVMQMADRSADFSLDLAFDVAAPGVTVAVSGDVDLLTAPALAGVLHGLLDDGRQRIVIDLARCRFVDARGVAVFAEVAQRAAGLGGSVTIRSASESTRRVLDITRVSELVMTLDAEQTHASRVACQTVRVRHRVASQVLTLSTQHSDWSQPSPSDPHERRRSERDTRTSWPSHDRRCEQRQSADHGSSPVRNRRRTLPRSQSTGPLVLHRITGGRNQVAERSLLSPSARESTASCHRH